MEDIRNSFINLADPMIFDSFGGDEFWERVEAPAGTIILAEGEGTQDFYYILSGTVDVKKSLQDEEGNQKRLAQLNSGDIFGEGALLSDSGRGASVVATVHTNLLKLTSAKFETLVQSDPQAAVGITLGIVKVQNGRLTHMNGRLVALYNVAKLTTQHAGDATKVIPAILNEVKRVVPGDHAIFNMEGLAQYQSDGADLETLQMQIPDFANRLSSAGAPPSFKEGSSLFAAVHDMQGNLKAILASKFDEADSDEDLRFLVSVAELLGHLF
jgi:CRP-like cAMP-binding protein